MLGAFSKKKPHCFPDAYKFATLFHQQIKGEAEIILILISSHSVYTYPVIPLVTILKPTHADPAGWFLLILSFGLTTGDMLFFNSRHSQTSSVYFTILQVSSARPCLPAPIHYQGAIWYIPDVREPWPEFGWPQVPRNEAPKSSLPGCRGLLFKAAAAWVKRSLGHRSEQQGRSQQIAALVFQEFFCRLEN